MQNDPVRRLPIRSAIRTGWLSVGGPRNPGSVIHERNTIRQV